MDFSALLTAPVIATIVVLAIAGTWVGYFMGRSAESKRREQALNEAAEASNKALEKIRREQAEKIDTLNHTMTDKIKKLKATHKEQSERLREEHSTLIDKLNADNLSHLNNLKKSHEEQIAQMIQQHNTLANEQEQRRATELKETKAEAAEFITTLKTEQQNALASLRQGLENQRKQRIQELQERHTRELAHMEEQAKALEEERDQLKASTEELQQSLHSLQLEIREAKLNNMFSVSKSGEKLIRVVRSVQELASELDETSRAVTDGEYSFFEAIKDKRDRETVLGLTNASTYTQVESEPESSSEEQDASDTESSEGNKPA
jgi:chromosome segregation ATPase